MSNVSSVSEYDNSYESDPDETPRTPTRLQTTIWGLKKQTKIALTAAASITATSGYIAGGAKLAQLITDTVFSYLPIDSTSTETADVSFWTLAAVCPFLLYAGVQSVRVEYRNYEEALKEQAKAEFERLQDEDGVLSPKKKINYISSGLKSFSTSANVVALCTNIIFPLMDKQTLDFRVTLGIGAVSFVANYYCQLAVYENADIMRQNRYEESRGNSYNRGIEPYCNDFDAKRTAAIDSSIAASILADTAETYGKIDPRQQFYGFAGEVAAIGGLCVYLAAQNKKGFVESKHKGKPILEDLETRPPLKEVEARYFNKKKNMIYAAAHLRAAAIGGSSADVIMRASQLLFDTNTMAIPASLTGMMIYWMSLDVLKKYFARGYVADTEVIGAQSPLRAEEPQNNSYIPPSISSPSLRGLDESSGSQPFIHSSSSTQSLN